MAVPPLDLNGASQQPRLTSRRVQGVSSTLAAEARSGGFGGLPAPHDANVKSWELKKIGRRRNESSDQSLSFRASEASSTALNIIGRRMVAVQPVYLVHSDGSSFTKHILVGCEMGTTVVPA